MNIFCRIFGHTFVHKVEEPKIRWTTSKNLSELDQTVSGEPEYYLECVRCGLRKDWEPSKVEVRLANIRPDSADSSEATSA